MESVLISIISVVDNDAAGLPRWLAHLENQHLPSSQFEIVVADIGSEQRASDILSRYAVGASAPMLALHLPEESPMAAKNSASEVARGQWLLFFHQDLLASPGLLEGHLQAQRKHAGAAAIVGGVTMHPQLSDGALTRWFNAAPIRKQDPQRELPFWKWDGRNLSLPRRTVLEAGAFDVAFPAAAYEDAELAWRLDKRGLHGYFKQSASGYIWRSISFAREREAQYLRGYALHRLLQITRSKEVQRMHNLKGFALRHLMQSTLMPLYVRACTEGEEDTRVFARLYRRIFRHDFLSGYSDAQKGRPPALTP